MPSDDHTKNWSGFRYRMGMVSSVLWLAACGGGTPLEADPGGPSPEPLTSMAVGTRPAGLRSSDKVLILESSVTNGTDSVEAKAARSLGYAVEVVSNAAWAAMGSADFAGYRAIILGDSTCGGSLSLISAASKSRGIWGPVVDGNVIIVGTDPVYHYKDQVTLNAVGFAAAQEGRTGAYISLSCYYHDTDSNTPVPILEPFGDFTVTGVGCYNDAHIVATHAALAGLTDAHLSNWNCSVHESFDSFPAANFTPLVIARDPAGGVRLAGSLDFADGSHGVPYVLARGAIPLLCGDGVVQYPEGCDTGANNGVPGTACSSVCRRHWCGDGTLDPGEQCDTGAANGTGSCSASCRTVSTNRPPVARCRDVTLSAGPTCSAQVPSVNDGSYDPDGDPVQCTQGLVGSLGLGSYLAGITCLDPSGLLSSCAGTVTVVDTTPPTITCPDNIVAECAGYRHTPLNAPVSRFGDNCSAIFGGPTTGPVVYVGETKTFTHFATPWPPRCRWWALRRRRSSAARATSRRARWPPTAATGTCRPR
jgi:hypothetical protein